MHGSKNTGHDGVCQEMWRFQWHTDRVRFFSAARKASGTTKLMSMAVRSDPFPLDRHAAKMRSANWINFWDSAPVANWRPVPRV